MKKTRITIAIVVALALTVLAGEALAGPGGGRGRGGGPGWGLGVAGRPRMGANLEPVQPDDYWRPGPYCPFAQGLNQNIQGRQGRGRGVFGQAWQGKGPGRFGQDFMGRGIGPYGQGYGRRDLMVQRGPMTGRGGRGFWGPGAATQDRSDRTYQRRNIAPRGWDMNNRQGRPGPGGIDRQGPGVQPRWFAPADTDQTNQQMPPRGRSWAPGLGQGWRQGRAPGWGQGWMPNPQSEKSPGADVPEPPIVEN